MYRPLTCITAQAPQHPLWEGGTIENECVGCSARNVRMMLVYVLLLLQVGDREVDGSLLPKRLQGAAAEASCTVNDTPPPTWLLGPGTQTRSSSSSSCAATLGL